MSHQTGAPVAVSHHTTVTRWAGVQDTLQTDGSWNSSVAVSLMRNPPAPCAWPLELSTRTRLSASWQPMLGVEFLLLLVLQAVLEFYIWVFLEMLGYFAPLDASAGVLCGPAPFCAPSTPCTPHSRPAATLPRRGLLRLACAGEAPLASLRASRSSPPRPAFNLSPSLNTPRTPIRAHTDLRPTPLRLTATLCLPLCMTPGVSPRRSRTGSLTSPSSPPQPVWK